MDDDDSEGDVPDFRKRIRRKRDKDRAAAAVAAEGGANGTGEASTSSLSEEVGEGEGGGGEGEGRGEVMEFASDGTYRNRQRVLLFSSRGITSRFRHLLADLRKLIPHHKKVCMRLLRRLVIGLTWLGLAWLVSPRLVLSRLVSPYLG